MGNKVFVIGVGPGNLDYMTRKAFKMIESCDLIIGAKRHLEGLLIEGKELLDYEGGFKHVVIKIKEEKDIKQIGVVVSGDPGIYSLTSYLGEKIGKENLIVEPGISSFQYFASKINETWNDIKITSLHGKTDSHLEYKVLTNEKVAIFTDSDNSPDSIARRFYDYGLLNIKIYVGQRLSYDNERIDCLSVEECMNKSFDNLSLMIIKNPYYSNLKSIAYKEIEDDSFIRDRVPMTKRDIRSMILIKLALEDGDCVYDIGAGTGSVSIAISKVIPNGRVIAIEKKEEACELILKNIKKFKCNNVKLIKGDAKEVLEELEEPNKVFIGGSGKNLVPIVSLLSKFKSLKRIIMTCVTIESIKEGIDCFENAGFCVNFIQLTVANGKKVADYHMLQGQNPIYIITARRMKDE